MTDYNVRLSSKPAFKVISTTGVGGGGEQMPTKFEDLLDVSISELDKNDKYVVMYNAVDKTYKLVNPDEVLSAATTDPIQPGLPSNFKDQLDIDLDDRIDVDGGEF